MIILQEGKICNFFHKCPYNKNGSCQGSNPHRKTVFSCGYTSEDGTFNLGKERSDLDKTGNMKIIMEGGPHV